MNDTSERDFYLIDADGQRRVPIKQRNSTDGRYGYSILTPGKGNDPSSGEYTEDIERLVRRVVLDGRLVRAKVVGGKKDGQVNSVGLGRIAVVGYWLAPHLRFLVGDVASIDELSSPDADQDIAEAIDLPEHETERRAVVAARRGQGKFRRDLDAQWRSCGVTGLQNVSLLRASHIQPWRSSNNIERMDPYNGLLLSANLDAAFDRGLLTFADDGRVLVNRLRLSDGDAAALGLKADSRLRLIDPRHLPYLAKHRALHGFDAEP